jgi:hypothetical protein
METPSMSRKILALPAAALMLAACFSTTENTTSDFGFIVLNAEPAGAGFEVDPKGYFYRTTNRIRLPDTQPTRDTCIRVLGSPPPLEGFIAPTISAGSAFQLTLSGLENQMGIRVDESFISYEVAGGEPIAFTPGDTVSIVIPGEDGGFRAWTLKAKTAEAFIAAPLPVYDVPSDVDIEWTPAEEPGSRMTLILLYPVGNQGMEHAYCELVDDGEATLEAGLVDAWRVAPAGSRQTIFTRQRFTSVSDGESSLLIASTLEVRPTAP